MLQSANAVDSSALSSIGPLSVMGLKVPIESVAPLDDDDAELPSVPAEVADELAEPELSVVTTAVVSAQFDASVHAVLACVVVTESVPESGSDPHPKTQTPSQTDKSVRRIGASLSRAVRG